MKFSEWWNGYKWNAGLEQGACDAYNEGLKEGRKRALEERTDTSQGGGSQKPSQGPQSCAFPCRAYETCKCRMGPVTKI
jgi:hypothetical protein